MKLPILVETGEAQSANTTRQKLINWYISKETSGRSDTILRPCPSIYNRFAVYPTAGTGCRGGERDNGLLVYGNGVFSVNTKRGDVATTANRAIMAAGGVFAEDSTAQVLYTANTPYAYGVGRDAVWQLDKGVQAVTGAHVPTGVTVNYLIDTTATFITDGVQVGMTVHNVTTDEYAKIAAVSSETQLLLNAHIFTNTTDTYEIKRGYGIDFTYPTSCTFLDGYFIVSSGHRFYISAQNDLNRWNPLDYGIAQAYNDNLLRVIAHNNDLWLIGARSTEIWNNTGNSDFPFEPVKHSAMQYGTISTGSVVQTVDALVWIATSASGKVSVVMSDGLTLKEISSPNIAELLNKLSPSSYFGITYSKEMHEFVVFSSATDNRSFSYDTSTAQWHDISTDGGMFDVGYVLRQTAGNAYTSAGRYSTNHELYMSYTNIINTGTGNRTLISPIISHEDRGLSFDSVTIEVSPNTNFLMQKLTSTQIIYVGTDLTPLITPGSDQILNLETGNAFTITGVSSSVITVASHDVGTRLTECAFLDASGDRLFDRTITLQTLDIGDTEYSTGKTKAIPEQGGSIVFRKLGKSSGRTIKLTVDDYIGTTIQAVYAEVSLYEH